MEFQKQVLEYRLWLGNEEYKSLYHYDNIELEEMLARRECEFFVKDGVTYKQVSSSIEKNLFVIYVEVYEESPPETIRGGIGNMITLEIRELNAIRNHPLLETKYLEFHIEVLCIIGSTFTFVNQLEYERDSAELDEDRKAYVLYVTPTGYEWED
ncbi:hypothetical protein [Bacillus massiliigorillae]|uniref:hypothetical protein n=1 Tax=Bacillus massiliigorillae TaxID=1243664 RepID=UPI0003A6873D|nr:hypothetical protein [Bacillus massiliigorillae]